MFNSTILDVIMGLIFVYLLLAIICSAINEWVARVTNLRATNLKAAINQLLDKQPGSKDPNHPDSATDWFVKKFYDHPLIAGMHDQRNANDKAHPSYIPSRAFATVVMDLVTPNIPGAMSFNDLQSGIQKLPGGKVREALLAVIQNANRDLHKAQKNIETWYDDTMERVGGWYKSKLQIWTILIAASLTLAANADTIRMAHILWINPTQRAQIAESAKARTQQSQGSSALASHDELKELDDLIGWGNMEKEMTQSEDCVAFWLKCVLGWFLTMIAVSLGAPFWFDLLNKIVNLRDSGTKPKTAEQNTAAAPPQPPAPAPTQNAVPPAHPAAPPAAPAPA